MGGEPHRVRPPAAIVVGASLLLVALVPVFVLGAIVYRDQQADHRSTALERIDAVATVQQARLETYLGTAIESAGLVASRTQMRVSLAEYVDGGGPSGGPAEALARVESILTDALAGSDLLVGVTIVDPAGAFVASVGVEVPGPVAEPARGPAVGAVVAVGDDPVLTVGAPLTLDDTPIGSAVIAVSTAPLETLTGDHTGLGETGETIVAFPSDAGAMYVTARRFDPEDLLPVPDDPGLPMRVALAGESDLVVNGADYRGEPVLAATRPIAGVGWGVVVKIDRAEALAPIAQLRRTLVLAGASAVAVVLALTSIVTHGLTRSVRRLAADAGSVADGDPQARTWRPRIRELAQVQATIEDMTGQLVGVNQRLERDVEERTMALSAANADLARVLGELETKNTSLEHLATHDALTGLPNRTLLEDRLRQAAAHATRDRSWVGVLFLDLDHFKAVNDQMGHEVGDAVLAEVAGRLRTRLREVDTICRLGGDEFVIVAGGMSSPADADVIAHDVAETIRTPIDVHGYWVLVGVSVGIVTVGPDETPHIDPADLIARADQAMLGEKRDSRSPATAI